MKSILLELTSNEFIRLRTAKAREEMRAQRTLSWREFIMRKCTARQGIHINNLKGGLKK